MAQKDYVSRAKRGGKRRKTAGKTKDSKTAKSSPVMMLALIAIIVAFVAGLYFLKTNNPTPPTPDVEKTANAKPKANVNAIPPTPPKRWDYVDALVNPEGYAEANRSESGKGNASIGISQEQQRILSMMAADRPQNTVNTPATYNQQVDRNSGNENRQVQTASSPSAASTSAQNWTLQCGSFRNKDGAESIKAQLALSGVSSRIVVSGNLHRVLVGPYKSKEAANNMLKQINAAGVQGCRLRG